MFGFIKKLFGGILAFLGGLFGSKKSQADESTAPKTRKRSGYYLELDPNQATPSENGKTTAKAEPAKAEVASPKPSEPAKAAPAATASAAKAKPAPAPEKPAPAPEPVTAAVAATPAPPAKPQPQAPKTFATELLSLSTTNGRRRPGANMNSFLDMARQVKPAR